MKILQIGKKQYIFNDFNSKYPFTEGMFDILESCTGNLLSISHMKEWVPYHTERTLQRHTKTLCELYLLERQIKNKKGHSICSYKTTELGKAALEIFQMNKIHERLVSNKSIQFWASVE